MESDVPKLDPIKELMISLVKPRPEIWDTTSEIYKDMNLKTTAWREICQLLSEGFDQRAQPDRQNFGQSRIKLWTEIKCEWMKYIQEQKTQNKCSTFDIIRTIPKELWFFEKIIDTSIAHESTCEDRKEKSNGEMRTGKSGIANNGGQEDTQGSEKKINTVDTRKKRKINEVDAKMMIDRQIKLLKKQGHGNRLLTFFESLLPSLSSFGDDEILDFQAGVINVVKTIKSQKATLFNENVPQTNYDEKQHPGRLPQHHGQSSQPHTSGSLGGMQSPLTDSVLSLRSQNPSDADIEF